MRKTNFLNIPIDCISMYETLEKVKNAINLKQQIHHAVVNAGKIILMQNDKELEKSVLEADIINADGQAVVWAANLFGIKIPERVAGIDLMQNLVELSFKKKYKCFFLGAKQVVVENLVQIYEKKFSANIIAGYRNGYFNDDDELKIAQSISESGANILFVAISSPKKEIFLNKYKQQLSNVNFIMGVGGSFDVIVGRIKRAPKLIQNLGLEWFFRFCQEPRRMWKRYLIGNTKFILLVIRAYFTRK
ncbi:MAG: glycosyltransferase [Flavobacteriales bacterium]|nr:glycosyltransferase [Flavobacteriales bacterium]|tara:strand:- start:31180 stop:31920 length:741 start_codon:yes stop_codon:yes gene_type:complete